MSSNFQRSHDIRWFGLMLVVIAMGVVIMRYQPIMGMVQVLLGAASAAWKLKRLFNRDDA